MNRIIGMTPSGSHSN